MRMIPMLRCAVVLFALVAIGSCAPTPVTSPTNAIHGLPSGTAAGVTLVVTVPGSTPAGDTVFVAGTFQQPTPWQPRQPEYALVKQPDGRWSITLDLPNGAHQFKFTRGG